MSLIDSKGLEPTADAPIAAIPEASNDKSWFIDEGVAAPGDKPEWLDPKFKTIKAAMQSLKELERKLGGTAPESYDTSKFSDAFDEGSEILSKLTSKAKSHRMSQDTFSDIVGEIAEYHKSLMPDTSAEIAKLGENPQRRLDTINQWISNNVSASAAEAIGKVAYTADFIEALDEIRQLHASATSKVPLGQQAQSASKILTLGEVRAEMEANYGRYKSDPFYRESIKQKFAQVVGDA